MRWRHGSKTSSRIASQFTTDCRRFVILTEASIASAKPVILTEASNATAKPVILTEASIASAKPVILTEASIASGAEGPRTASRQRSRYRF
jgi:hypothetical protein